MVESDQESRKEASTSNSESDQQHQEQPFSPREPDQRFERPFGQRESNHDPPIRSQRDKTSTSSRESNKGSQEDRSSSSDSDQESQEDRPSSNDSDQESQEGRSSSNDSDRESQEEASSSDESDQQHQEQPTGPSVSDQESEERSPDSDESDRVPSSTRSRRSTGKDKATAADVGDHEGAPPRSIHPTVEEQLGRLHVTNRGQASTRERAKPAGTPDKRSRVVSNPVGEGKI